MLAAAKEVRVTGYFRLIAFIFAEYSLLDSRRTPRRKQLVELVTSSAGVREFFPDICNSFQAVEHLPSRLGARRKECLKEFKVRLIER